MKNVFVAVKAQLKAEVSGILQLERWNNQLSNEGTGPALVFPAIYYQVDGVKMETLSHGIQHGTGILRIRYCDKQLRASDLKTYDYEAAGFLALQGFKGGPILTGLDRIAIYPDPNHGAVEVVIQEYRLKYEDRSQFEARNQVRAGGTLTPEIGTEVQLAGA